MFKRKKFLIGGIIIFLAIGYLAYTGFESSTIYYYTVSEFLSQEPSNHNETVRLNGQVVADSVISEPGGRTLKFTLAESGKSLPVIYRGAVPDAFRTDIDVIVEGHLNSSGVFEASTIVTKCPSKYVPKE